MSITHASFGAVSSSSSVVDVRRLTALYRGLVPVHSNRASTYGAPPTGAQFSSGLTNNTYRWRYDVLWPATSLTAAFGNISAGLNPGTNDVTVGGASLELADGTILRWLFRGQQAVVLKPGGMIVADPVQTVVPVGPVYVRVNVQVASGGWPIDLTGQPTRGDGFAAGDLTASGAVATSSAMGYSPMNLLGEPVGVSPKVVAVMGDSIAHGKFDSDPDRGFLQAALDGHVAIIKQAYGSTRFEQIAATGFPQYITGVAVNATDAIVQWGVNDFRNSRTDTQLRADTVRFGTWLSTLGIRSWLCTVTPDTSWGGLPAWETQRTTHNDWRRTVPAPYVGCFEVADLAETARNSGTWKPGLSDDGLHPNGTGVAALAAAINPAVFA